MRSWPPKTTLPLPHCAIVGVWVYGTWPGDGALLIECAVLGRVLRAHHVIAEVAPQPRTATQTEADYY